MDPWPSQPQAAAQAGAASDSSMSGARSPSPSQPQAAAQAGAASDSSMSGARFDRRGSGSAGWDSASSAQDPSLSAVPEDRAADQEMTPAHTVQLYTDRYGQMLNERGERVDRWGRPTRARGCKGSGSRRWNWNSGW